jgi:chorismate mutase
MTITCAPVDTLLALVVRRLAVAETVAAAKWNSGRPVEDRAREAVVVAAAAARAQRAGIDATFVRRVMAAQIEASKIVQRGLLARWRDEPGSAPTSRPELSGVRPTLDAIDQELVAALAAPRSPRAVQGRALEDPDGLRRRALACALAPLDR